MNRRTLVVGSLLALVFLVAGAASGQPSRPPATLDDLLTEVQGLRAEVREAAAAGLRTQVLATRLSLQERRIWLLRDQWSEARRALAAGEEDHRARAAHLKEVEEARRAGRAPLDRTGELDAMLVRLREEVAQAAREEQALVAREQQVRDALAAEESLWVHFSSRLEVLERELATAR